MKQMNNTIEIMNEGINCLIRELGVVKAEEFISIINREKFDYTKWRQNLFEDMSLEELNNAAADFAKKNPF
ncbi:MAG: hypothetical protein J1F11_10075 [Oscillospiraceae bacterium]|nr:hypothetical protein [Oscillospiraceae bacterium]